MNAVLKSEVAGETIASDPTSNFLQLYQIDEEFATAELRTHTEEESEFQIKSEVSNVEFDITNDDIKLEFLNEELDIKFENPTNATMEQFTDDKFVHCDVCNSKSISCQCYFKSLPLITNSGSEVFEDSGDEYVLNTCVSSLSDSATEHSSDEKDATTLKEKRITRNKTKQNFTNSDMTNSEQEGETRNTRKSKSLNKLNEVEKDKNQIEICEDTEVHKNSIITISCAKKNDGKRVRDKTHSCYICNKILHNMARHFESVHSKVTQIARILAMPLGSRRRRVEFENLIKVGDFYHNCNVLNMKQGELILVRRPEELSAFSVSDFGPCPNCLGFMLKKHLWHHMKFGCKIKNSKIGNSSQSKGPLNESAALLFNISGKKVSADFRQNIIDTLRSDAISISCKEDDLILNLGVFLFDKYGRKQSELIRQSMRQLGRLKIQLKEFDNSIKTLIDCLTPEKFYRIIDATKSLCGINRDVGKGIELKVPSLALKIGYLLRKCVALERGDAIKRCDVKKSSDLQSFLTIVDNEWSTRISSNAVSTLHNEKISEQQLKDISIEDLPEVELGSENEDVAESASDLLQLNDDDIKLELLNEELDIKSESSTDETTAQFTEDKSFHCNVCNSKFIQQTCQCYFKSLPSTDNSGSKIFEDSGDEYVRNRSVFSLLDSATDCSVDEKEATTLKDKRITSKNKTNQNSANSDQKGETCNIKNKSEIVSKLNEIDQDEKEMEICEDTEVHKNSIITISCAKKHDGKRVRDKTHSCYICNKILHNNMARHFESVHSEDTQIARILAMPLGSRLRRVEFENLIKVGDFYHNCNVLNMKQGELILVRRPEELSAFSVSDFGPCPNCLGFMLKKHLWHHMKFGCKIKTSKTRNSSTTKGPLNESTALLFNISGKKVSTDFRQHIIVPLRSDAISISCKEDDLILNIGVFLFDKYGKKQSELIRQSMRQLGRLKIQLKEFDNTIKNLIDWLTSEKFDHIIHATKSLCSSNRDVGKGVELKVPSLASKIGYLLRKCVALERRDAIKRGDVTKSNDLQSFLTMVDNEWSTRISSNTVSTLHNEKLSEQQLKDISIGGILPRGYASTSKVSNKQNIAAKSKCNRKVWSIEEKQCVLNHFGALIRNGLLPGKTGCEECIMKYPILKGRKWSDLKFCVKNHLSKINR